MEELVCKHVTMVLIDYCLGYFRPKIVIVIPPYEQIEKIKIDFPTMYTDDIF